MQPFETDDLIIRFLTGETTPSENKMLSDWLGKSKENLSYFNSIRNIWLASSQIPEPVEVDQRIPSDLKIELSNTKGSQKNILNTVLKVAAILLIAIISGAILNNQLSRKPVNLISNAVAVEATLGSIAIATLPDGTKVWLNGGSKLVYDGTYNAGTREVKLTGEAYFDVVTNPSKPFVVKAGKINIKALGTKFNVKAYPEDASIVTTLEKGKVVIEGTDNSNKEFLVEMKPKETVTYLVKESIIQTENSVDNKTVDNAGENLTVSQYADITNPVTKTVDVKTELFTSWKDNRWIIEKQRLDELARDLERRYNIKIIFTSDSVRKFHFSGSIENETIEQVLLIMRHTIPLKYKIEKGVVNIEQDNKLLKEFYR